MRMVEKSINPKTVDGRPSWPSVEDRRGERFHRARLLAPDGSTRALRSLHEVRKLAANYCARSALID